MRRRLQFQSLDPLLASYHAVLINCSITGLSRSVQYFYLFHEQFTSLCQTIPFDILLLDVLHIVDNDNNITYLWLGEEKDSYILSSIIFIPIIIN